MRPTCLLRPSDRGGLTSDTPACWVRRGPHRERALTALIRSRAIRYAPIRPTTTPCCTAKEVGALRILGKGHGHSAHAPRHSENSAASVNRKRGGHVLERERVGRLCNTAGSAGQDSWRTGRAPHRTVPPAHRNPQLRLRDQHPSRRQGPAFLTRHRQRGAPRDGPGTGRPSTGGRDQAAEVPSTPAATQAVRTGRRPARGAGDRRPSRPRRGGETVRHGPRNPVLRAREKAIAPGLNEVVERASAVLAEPGEWSLDGLADGTPSEAVRWRCSRCARRPGRWRGTNTTRWDAQRCWQPWGGKTGAAWPRVTRAYQTRSPANVSATPGPCAPCPPSRSFLGRRGHRPGPCHHPARRPRRARHHR